MDEQQIKEYILSRFEKFLSLSKYKLARNYIGNHPNAIITTPEGYPHCIVEIVDRSNSIQKLKNKAVENPKAKYTIVANLTEISNSETYWFFESGKSGFEDKTYNDYDEIIKKIIPEKNELEELISQYLKDNFTFFKNKNFELVGLKGQQVSLKEEKIEREWIEELFDFKFENFSEHIFPEHIYRYVSLKSVFETLKSGEIRMNGIAGMNDISEVDYVEKFLYGRARPNSEVNKIFILSCSVDKEDDLTQWRLYADDAKGVCLKFEPRKEVFEKDSKFVLQKIKYIDGESYPPIKQLKELVKDVYRLTGYTFVLKTLHKWCHFIKPKDYKVESEIRLLYISSEEPSEWVLADKINIANPYKNNTLDNTFPLKLTKIILGPKCPDRETNKFQLETLIKNKPDLKDIEISTSKIKNYR